MIKEYGDGAFQTLSMRVRQDSEVAELRGWKGVDLLVHSLHDDGSGKDCQVTLDLEAGDLSRLIVQLHADLERKVSRLKSEHDERITDLLIDFLFRTKAIHETSPPNTLQTIN